MINKDVLTSGIDIKDLEAIIKSGLEAVSLITDCINNNGGNKDD